MNHKKYPLLALLLLVAASFLQAQVVNVGSGSYTKRFPGTDAAGRNGFPSGKPLTTGKAALTPPPTNDWWSAKIKNPHCDNLFNYPFTMKTVNSGLVTTYIPWGVIDDIQPIIVGVSSLNSTTAWVSDFSDWTLQMVWKNSTHEFKATTGVGMPFLYFEKDSQSTARITVNSGTVTVSQHRLIIENARNSADFVVFAPSGSTWTANGNVYTSDLNGQNFWSMMMLPHQTSQLSDAAQKFEKYAYVFPRNTYSQFQYKPEWNKVITEFHVEVEVMQGTDSLMLQGLLPHQWSNFHSETSAFIDEKFRTVRGDLKLLSGNSFVTAHPFRGILPTLPYLDEYSVGFSGLELKDKIEAIMNDGLSDWTDSYNEGQVMNRLIQTARIAKEMHYDDALAPIVKTIKTRLENWLKAEANEKAFLFYYDTTWKSLLGYPAGHGQDHNLNDHHFHWGYFIHAAAFMEEFEPGWAKSWGSMINLLVRDAASQNRNDSLFPFLRNFNPYQGHCWANGFASFPQGNDQESTSESMQFNSSLIHWGSITGDTQIRDLGIYLYATEQAAIEEYWFDKNQRNFHSTQPYKLVSRVWGNSYDNGTFWTADIAASYGIELYPIHGGSFYLGHDTTYTRALWNEMAQNTGILNNQANDNLWHDVYWCYLALIDASRALSLYDSYPKRNLKFGISDAQTYHWLHALNAMGRVDTAVVSPHPLALCFTQNGARTYVAKNDQADTLVVPFSDGYVLQVPPFTLRTNLDIDLKATLKSDFLQAYYEGSVNVTLEVSGGSFDHAVVFNGKDSIGMLFPDSLVFKTPPLKLGWNDLYARVYQGETFKTTNFVRVRVGDIKPYLGEAHAIPGTLNAAHYDVFEGGQGQGLTYVDFAPKNEGDFRTDERVDASSAGAEGDIVSYIDAGEWLNYTVSVQESALYDVQIRYASNNAQSGPLQIEINGEVALAGVTFNTTGGWDKWSTKTLNNLALKAGNQTLTLRFMGAGFNLGKLTFTKKTTLTTVFPKAVAGPNVSVHPNLASFSLDGSQSTGQGTLNFEWSQVYGPTVLEFENALRDQTQVSHFEKGVYKCQLRVNDGTYSDVDDIYIVVSETPNTPPTVALIHPQNGQQFWEGQHVPVKIQANDLIGSVVNVRFFVNDEVQDSAAQTPYEFSRSFEKGTYVLHAEAKDDSGVVVRSVPVSITVKELPSCRFPSKNRDFDVVFSDDKSHPTMTFIPKSTQTGSPTCILYYGTNPSNRPGYNVKPNVPFKINAPAGSTVYYYYTYSFAGSERNTAADQAQFEVGLCKAEPTNSTSFNRSSGMEIFPNPTSTQLHVRLEGKALIQLFSVSGEAVSHPFSIENEQVLDVSQLTAGYYVVQVILPNGSRMHRPVMIR
jgi:endo-1,3(4)-beta-glucanase